MLILATECVDDVDPKKHVYDHRHDVEPRQTYIYGLCKIVLLRPDTNQTGKKFRLVRVVAYGQGEHKGKYTVEYLTSAQDYGMYKTYRDVDGSCMFRKVWEESVQDIVHMDGHGTKISDQSEVMVRYWVDHWRKTYGEMALDEQAVADNQVMIVMDDNNRVYDGYYE